MKRGRSNDQYDVEEILEMKYVNGAPYYKVKWLDYPIKDATWEPKENLMSVDWMIDKFENKLIESRSKTYGENSIVSKKVLAKSIAKEKKKSIAAYSYEEYGLMAPKSFSKPNREKIMHINFPEPTPSFVFDIPKEIKSMKRDINGLNVLIDWEPRLDGTTLKSTWHNTKDLRKHKRFSRMLLSYYESIIEG